jgi:cell division GTPase FtsZ
MDRRRWIQSVNGLIAVYLLPELAVAHDEPEFILELRRSITNAIAREPCYLGVDFEDLEHLILAQEGQCAFGFGYASQGQAAADLAIAHPRLGLGRLKQATDVLIWIETPVSALKMGVFSGIMKHVRQYLPADCYVFFSDNTNQPQDGENFRVSIFAAGISDKSQTMRHKMTHP